MIFSQRDPAPFTTPHPLDTYGTSPPPYWNPKYATDFNRSSVHSAELCYSYASCSRFRSFD